MVPWQGAWEGKDKYALLFFFFNYFVMLFCHQVLSDSLWPLGLQHARLPCPSLSSKVCANSLSIELVMPFNHLIFYCLLPLAFNLFQHQGLFHSSSLYQVAKILELQLQSFPWIFRTDLLALQGTLKSSLAPQFESINSLMLSLLYGPSLTSIPDYWTNHSFD